MKKIGIKQPFTWIGGWLAKCICVFLTGSETSDDQDAPKPSRWSISQGPQKQFNSSIPAWALGLSEHPPGAWVFFPKAIFLKPFSFGVFPPFYLDNCIFQATRRSTWEMLLVYYPFFSFNINYYLYYSISPQAFNVEKLIPKWNGLLFRRVPKFEPLYLFTSLSYPHPCCRYCGRITPPPVLVGIIWCYKKSWVQTGLPTVKSQAFFCCIHTLFFWRRWAHPCGGGGAQFYSTQSMFLPQHVQRIPMPPPPRLATARPGQGSP